MLCTGIEDALAAVRVLPPNAREVILVPDDLTGETAWAALKRRCEEKDTAFSVSRWLPDGASLHDVLRLDGPEALTQTLGAALSSPLLHKTCKRLHHDWHRHIETAQASGVPLTQASGYEGLTARLQSMTDALSGHHGPAPEALVLALHQLVRRPLDAALPPHTEALCRRYLGGGAQDGRWPFRIIRGKERFPASVALSGPERGTWTNETTDRQGGLLDLIRLEGKHHNDLAAALSLYAEAFCRRFLSESVRTVHRPGVLAVRGQKESLTVRLSGLERGTWTHETTGRQGDLLDLIRIEGKHHNDFAATMAAGRAFLEAQLRQQHKMSQDLEQKQTKHKSRGHGMSL